MRKNLYKRFATLIALLLLVTSMPMMAFANSKDKKEKIDSPPVSITKLKGKETSKAEEKSDDKKAIAKVTKIDVFGLKETDITALYKAYSGKFMVSPIYKQDENYSKFVPVLNQLKDNSNVKAVEVDADDAAEFIEASFLAVLKDGTRRVYTLNTNNVIQAGNDGYFQIPAEQYNALLAIYNAKSNSPSFAQWLIYMIPGNVSRISYEDTEKGQPVMLGEEYIPQMTQLIRGTAVANGKHYTPLKYDFVPGNGKSRITLYFDEQDTHYTIWIDGTTMYIEAGGMHIGTQYTISANQANALKNAFKDPASAFQKTTTSEAA